MDYDKTIRNLEIIYQPKGRAYEFAHLALNQFTGCTHGCEYCFNKDGPLGKGYFDDARVKKDVIKRVKKDAAKLQHLAKTDSVPEILISFVGDPYQPVELELNLTRDILSILIAHKLKFTILTKGGLRAVKDFDLLKNFPDAQFGTSLTFFKDFAAEAAWEPQAASYYDRVEAIRRAYEMGITTWVSLEPVIDPADALAIIQELHPIVDHWKVGKINHTPELEDQHDWIQFRTDIKKLFNVLNISNYYIKNSLTEL